MKIENAHALEIGDLLRALGTDAKSGLSDTDAQARFAEYGPNALAESKKPSLVLLFLKQFHSILTYILLVAGAISIAAGEAHDAYGIGIAVLLKAVIGFVQERRAEAAIERLRHMVVQEATVVRDGRPHRVPASTVVPGDILVLEEGSRVAADARILEARELQTDESALTGESSSVEKAPGAAPEGTQLPDRTGMVWMGTGVTGGWGKAVVIETGSRTQFGAIAESLRKIVRGLTPLETRLDRLGRQLGIAAIVLSAIALIAGVSRGFPLTEMFFFAVAMIVSVVPEGLPAVLAVVLAIGVQRMAKRNAIVRHVPSVETLGAADVICTDKTGTLTENKMTVREIAFVGHDVTVSGEGWEPRGEFSRGGRVLRPSEIPELDRLLVAAALSSSAEIEMRDERFGIVGDATEGAMTVVAAKAGIEKPALAKEYTIIDEVPFSSVRKYHAVLAEHVDLRGATSRMLFVAGAYGVLRDRSASASDGSTDVPFDAKAIERLNAANEAMASRTLRVLAIAAKRMPDGADSLRDADVTGLTMLGLVGMIDPPRHGVAQAIERCRRAGIRVMMLTGDQKATAVAIGREIGLIDGAGDAASTVFTEKEAAAMDDAAFVEALKGATIFARVSPETKLRIVGELQKLGKTVAMTGDGVNDAPALKKASIGVAMGITGSDVSKEVADMVLADDNFVSIVNAVEEGRIVFRNVRQTTGYLFMTNIGEALTLLVAILIGLPLPLLPAQILWMNLVTDGFPDMALASEPANGDMLSGPPRRKDEPILSRGILALSALTASLMCAGTLGLFVWAQGRGDLAYARTVAFTVMAMFQLWNVFNMRSTTASMFTLGLRSNPYVLAAVGFSVLLQLLVLYHPALQRVFDTAPLGGVEWVAIVAVSSTVFFAAELWKIAVRRRVAAH